jgi:hypothetical protein
VPPCHSVSFHLLSHSPGNDHTTKLPTRKKQPAQSINRTRKKREPTNVRRPATKRRPVPRFSRSLVSEPPLPIRASENRPSFSKTRIHVFAPGSQPADERRTKRASEQKSGAPPGWSWAGWAFLGRPMAPEGGWPGGDAPLRCGRASDGGGVAAAASKVRLARQGWCWVGCMSARICLFPVRHGLMLLRFELFFARAPRPLEITTGK